jgi:type II secretory pathway pseudopilin PulG
MTTRRHDEAGETLVEILIALIIMGLVVGAFFGAITTGSNASRSERNLASADAVLRNYAETAKQSVRVTCLGQTAGTPFTVGYTPPSGFQVTANGPNGLTCPSPSGVNEIDIVATTPSGTQEKLSIDVRTP